MVGHIPNSCLTMLNTLITFLVDVDDDQTYIFDLCSTIICLICGYVDYIIDLCLTMPSILNTCLMCIAYCQPYAEVICNHVEFLLETQVEHIYIYVQSMFTMFNVHWEGTQGIEHRSSICLTCILPCPTSCSHDVIYSYTYV